MLTAIIYVKKEAKMKKIIFKVEGMMCPMCESHANGAVRNIYPKAKVSSSHKSGETIVVGEGIDPTRVKESIEKTGYRVLEIKEEEYVKKGFFASLFSKK